MLNYAQHSALSRDLTISHLGRILRFELWVASNIWLVLFNFHAPVVTEFIVKVAKSPISLLVKFFGCIKPRVMQALIT